VKKIGLGIIGLLILGAIYYFTAGATQITAEMKQQVNTQLTSIQKEGFSVQNREIKENEEHFVLSFDEPKKIAHFLTRQGVQLGVNDAELLKGLQVGVDVNYLSDAYSAVSFDMYPVTLPTLLIESSQGSEDKKVLDQIQKMLDKKTFLMHIAVNKVGTGFKGHMKDINEVLHGEKDVTLIMDGLTFSGDIKDEQMQSVTQNLTGLTMHVPDELDMTLSHLITNYVVTGETPYDYSTHYNIEKVIFDARSDFNFLLNDVSMKSTSTVKNGLVSGTMHTKTKSMRLTKQGKDFAFDTFVFDIAANNFNIKAFEKLEHIDVNNEAEMNALLQELLSKGVTLSIPAFSIKSIGAEGQKMDGFDLNAKVDIDKSLNIIALENNPMSALSAIDANLNINLSKELFSIVAQQPQALMALMLFQPKDVNGKKSYKLDLKDGKLTVNGTPML